MADQSLLDRFKTDDIAAADALLRSFETASDSDPRPVVTPEPEPEPAERQAAPTAVVKSDETTNPLPPGAPAAAEPATAPQQQNTETQAGTKINSSAFAKDQDRLKGGWKTLNEEKTRVATERQAVQNERVRLQQEQQKFEQRREGANKNKLTPEVYDQSASQQEKFVNDAALQLDGLRARKARYEEAGNYTEAAKLDQQIEQMQENVAVAKYQAKQFKEIAANMRQNPDVSGEALQKRNQEHLTHYTVEAAKKWPELAQNGSEFQKSTAKAIKILRDAGLDENDSPVLRYFAAEHVAAQSAAARVPEMEKALAKANARVKELETLNIPGGGITAQPNLRPGTRPQTLEAEGEVLRQFAEAKGGRG